MPCAPDWLQALTRRAGTQYRKRPLGTAHEKEARPDQEDCAVIQDAYLIHPYNYPKIKLVHRGYSKHKYSCNECPKYGCGVDAAQLTID
jgi:hypothetical protein